MKKYSIVLLMMLLSIPATFIAQNITELAPDSTTARLRSHGAISRATMNKIILRWAPTDPTYWDMGNTYGYTIERIVLNAEPFSETNTFTDEEMTWKPLSSVPLRPWSLEQFKAAAQDTSNKYIGVAMEMLYGEAYANQELTKGEGMANALNEQQNKHAYAMMAADLDADAALSLGLRYEDNDVKAGQFYLYRIYINHKDADFPTDTTEIYIDFSKKYKPMQVTNMWQEAGDKEIMLGWTKSNQNNFSAYDIERSDDGKIWKKLNKRPYVSSFDKGEKSFIYIDSLVVNSKSYSYRLKGFTPFGDQGLYSEIITSIPKDLTPPAPAYSVKASDVGGVVKIEWEATPTETDFDGFYVGRSALASGGFTKISKKLDKKERAFIDFQADPLNNNYYAVFSVDKSGNESMSYVDLGYIVDSLPPVSPTGVKGVIDSTGLVKLSWERGPEADLIGYRVYWSNDTLSEFSQLTGDVISTTSYTDSVNIKTLSEYSYYKIVAVDHRYNHSEYSKILKLQKPDVVPPAIPVFNNYNQGQKEVHFSWINSTSTDVVKHKLERKSKDEEWKEVIVFLKKEKEWTDKSLEVGQSYSYRLIALDDAGNKSVSKPLMITAIDRGLRPDIEGFKKISKEGNNLLEWNYGESGNYVFVIYKENQEKTGFVPIGRVNKNEKNYVITDQSITYGIRAVYSDGGESHMAKTK